MENIKEHLETGNSEMEELVKAMESIDKCYGEIAGEYSHQPGNE